MLSQTPTRIVVEPKEYMTMIFGGPGVGKTSWAAQIPGHYFLLTEQGVSGVSVYGSYIFSFPEFETKCIELVEGKESGWRDQRPVEVIVVDVYERLFRLAGQYICETETFIDKGVAKKYKQIEDVPWGRGYGRTTDFLVEKFVKLRLFGFGIVLICHAQDKTFEWNKQDVMTTLIDLSKVPRNGILSQCDASGYFYVEGEEKKDAATGKISSFETGRWMQWQPTFCVPNAKHRLSGFPERLKLERGVGWQTYVDTFEEYAKLETKSERIVES